jgi:membrane-associated phospholipid phosphatase
VGALIRMTAGRFRPIETDGLNHWELFRGFHDGRDLAWPSGHATLAFATAAVLTYLSPRGRCLFLILAAGCAIARVVMQAHFWSDATFGAVLGWTIGWSIAVLADHVIAPRTTP